MTYDRSIKDYIDMSGAPVYEENEGETGSTEGLSSFIMLLYNFR